MKKYYYIIGLAVLLTAGACKKEFLDQQPLDSPTTASFFQNTSQFKSFANDFYNKMIGFRPVTSGVTGGGNSNIYDFMDAGSDLTEAITSYGQGAISVPASDIYWVNAYAYIRANNVLIQAASVYTGDQAAIKQYVAAAYFFRAWHHFFLLKRYGGVPIITKVLDVNSPELNAPRNTRYEVANQILRDLDVAIAGLPLEANIAAADKGQVSQQAAKAFKARVLLYEATWEKYVGTTTDFAQNQKKGDSTTTWLTQAASLASQVMTDNTYSLFKGVDTLSYYYMFNLDDANSNPKGLTKTSNNEYILSSHYDFTLLQGNANLTHTLGGYGPSRKMMDMYLCTDGLPFSVSPLAKGYAKMTDEFDNREWRLRSLVYIPKKKYWGFGATTGANYNLANYITTFNFPAIITPAYPDLATNINGGYGNRKFCSEESTRADYQESYDYPQIRLAEVYLIYAEAKCELGGGAISDADLNISINKIRARNNVAPLTNALIAPYPSLTMLGEIRRERALELYLENSRFDDLKRWGIAETELNQPIEGMVVQYNGSATEVATGTNPITKNPLYNASKFVYGIDSKTGAVIIDPATNRKFKRMHYLYPIPNDQRSLNPNLVQNPNY
ncbi:putative outer membrane starch-binding protein [Mucilaginibacter yixingensis]|uniref:Putative outer membrane starch-binding protein n=1 Tax=Mucilaginibacter yixingensis TaxID=1295612 RepID=A0A2T5J617_9SPHI|nr:RagB/SusD family nutrient uptake outer membrane protein [Mucilaginibacter yixingensis]PTQ93660.1 putative outer membrane starch-binding protein [Mucilaginibacter yixingensis]